MTETYKAVEVSAPGTFRIVQRPVFHPGAGQVRIRVKACGFCHDESYYSSRTLFRWILVDWFPEQPIVLRLPRDFKIPHSAEFDFDVETQQLLKIVEATRHARSPDDWGLSRCLEK